MCLIPFMLTEFYWLFSIFEITNSIIFWEITGLAAANAVIGKFPMFVTEKSKNPSCFKILK